MSYSIYVNNHRKRATVHADGCSHVKKHGGEGEGYWIDCLNDYEDAWEYIEKNIDENYSCQDCKGCL